MEFYVYKCILRACALKDVQQINSAAKNIFVKYTINYKLIQTET